MIRVLCSKSMQNALTAPYTPPQNRRKLGGKKLPMDVDVLNTLR